MKNIERISLIDKSNLNEEFYFTSLMEEAYRQSLLCEGDIEKIQIECLELLAYKIECYTGGESSSVRVELAESIMQSNLYTIGLYLKSFPFADDAVKALTTVSIFDIYEKGRKTIDSKLRTAKNLHHMVVSNLLKTDNYTYNKTIVDAIKGFFRIYNADFEAHKIQITADYPLCNPIENLAGIEFIEEYLKSVYFENMFCSYFHHETIANLLYSYDDHYKDMIFNLFEQVFTCAIGCELAKKPFTNLDLTIIEVEHIYTSLLNKSMDEVEIIVTDAYYEILKKLEIIDPSLRKYMKKALTPIICNIFNAVKIDKLERVFVYTKSPKTNTNIYFSIGDKMDDEKYRIILDEIVLCRYASDKVAIIKNDVNSLSDLEDIFFDANLNANEINAILTELDLIEIAALAKRHPYKTEIETIDLDETEIAFRLCLNEFIQSLPQEKQTYIESTINLIDFRD